ncbi:exosortase-associated protein EpsI, B-type [Pseudoduganella namucuonensis]|uniref:EpsI family protein n=1 Tax=Pseudoduganella namucuonensis TaxID=1035707 RepID=A0A1I7I0S8_9BURK|nr:exosortase-associated protein EpsI, B-type [Pseudoduganella namucuonensis]SFU66558.1 EpsI family protein [Pseudoduganella namucuonensis]
MRTAIVTSAVLCALMLSAGALSRHLTPTVKMADSGERFQLGAIVPQRFGDWSVDASIVPLQVDPATQATLDKIYNQTLSRTYVDAAGQRVMLSLAYGGDQSDTMAVHKPEVCYTAQGFEVSRQRHDTLATGDGAIPVKRLFAVSGQRQEPITYWITVGDKAIKPGLDQKLQQLRYGLSGTVPDGMLVRVSTIGGDTDAAYRVQDRFINDLLRALNGKDRVRLVGVPAQHSQG